MQPITKYLPLATMLLIYYFVCGSLFEIGFWHTFNLDITSLISISEIPKNVVSPFIKTQVLGVIMAVLLLLFSKIEKGESNYDWMKRTNPKAHKTFRFIIRISLLIVVGTAVALHKKHQYTPAYWDFFTLFISILISLLLLDNKWIESKIKSTALKLFTTLTIIYLPLACLAVGKITSIDIFKNKEVQYISFQPNLGIDKEYKLIRIVNGDKAVIAPLDNHEIVIINLSVYNYFTIKK